MKMHLEFWLWVNTEYYCGKAKLLNQASCKCDYMETTCTKAVNLVALYLYQKGANCKLLMKLECSKEGERQHSIVKF